MAVIFFSAGYFLSGDNFFLHFNDKKALLAYNYQLKKDNQSLLKEKLQLQSDLKIERSTVVLLKQQLAKQSLITTELTTELNFYKGIVNDSSNNSGVFFQKISIIPLTNSSNLAEIINTKIDFDNYLGYKLDFSLVKKIKKKTYRNAHIQVVLLDDKGKKITQWKMFDKQGKQLKKLKIRFQAFASKQAYFLVKKTQTISKIKISFIDSLRSKNSITKEFNWIFGQQKDKLNEKNKGIIYVGK